MKKNEPSMSLSELLKMTELLSIGLYNNCSDCGNERTIVKFEDLPETTRKAFAGLLKMPEYKTGATFLYCKHCDHHSILSSPSFGKA